MLRKQLFNDSWNFHAGELEQKPASSTSKAGVCGLASNLTNKEGGKYELSRRYWSVFGISTDDEKAGLMAGNAVIHMAEDLTDEWVPVELPHDWKFRQDYQNMSSTEISEKMGNVGSDCLPDGLAYYRKLFKVEEEAKNTRTVIEFEGAMHHAEVWVNGFKVGSHQSGYSSFSIDISEYLNYGEGRNNIILVKVDSFEHEGWWGEGSGLYRNVWLYHLPAVHVENDSVYAKTEECSADHAVIRIQAGIVNETDRVKDVTSVFLIKDCNDNQISSQTLSLQLKPFETKDICLQFDVERPCLWDLEHPNLYTLKVKTSVEDINDSYEQKFGIRDIVYNREGLFLNGKKTRLNGVCLHQDHAGVGIALDKDLVRFRVKRIKDMGGNAIRSCHHAASNDLLQACDELGILLMNETRHFGLEREEVADFENMIRRSRNHPSVFMYCVSNEEFIEIMPQGKQLLKRFIEIGRIEDDKRPFTVAAQFGKDDYEYQKLADVSGYNYDDGQSLELMKVLADQPVIATEDASFVSTRGIYEDSPKDGWCDSYEGVNYYLKLLSLAGIDTGTMGGALNAPPLSNVYKTNNIINPSLGGMFVWTAFDYRGETFPWNWPAVISSYGAMDFCGFEKDAFYYWKSIWTNEPIVHILPHWTWPGKEGQELHMEAYSNCDEVKVYVNDVLKHTERNTLGNILKFELVYEPGVLKIEGWKEGKKLCDETYITAEEPESIVLEKMYEGENSIMLKAKVVDKNGNFCPTAMIPVKFNFIKGLFVGSGNGNPATHESDLSSERTTFNGLAFCIVSKDGGPIEVNCSSGKMISITLKQ